MLPRLDRLWLSAVLATATFLGEFFFQVAMFVQAVKQSGWTLAGVVEGVMMYYQGSWYDLLEVWTVFTPGILAAFLIGRARFAHANARWRWALGGVPLLMLLADWVYLTGFYIVTSGP
jgi:hypothetical protein